MKAAKWTKLREKRKNTAKWAKKKSSWDRNGGIPRKASIYQETSFLYKNTNFRREQLDFRTKATEIKPVGSSSVPKVPCRILNGREINK